MNNLEFEYPYIFLLLFLIICIYKCPATIKKIIFPHTELFERFTSIINREKLLYSLIFALLVSALASPISYDAKISQNRNGRDLVFAIDTSGSMGESGFSTAQKNSSKFTLVKEIITSFINKRYDDNVGVTVFGSFAFASVPLTYDMHAVGFLLQFLDVGIAGENTAIGDGITNALKILQHGHAKHKVIILITDGYQNSGSTSVKDAVMQAKKEHVKIYTIGLGDTKSFDTKLLQKISQETGGIMLQAENEDALERVYEKLNELEPSPIRSQHFLHKHMLFLFPLSFAMLLLLYLLSKRGRI